MKKQPTKKYMIWFGLTFGAAILVWLLVETARVPYLIKRLELSVAALHVNISPNNEYIIAGGRNGVLRLWSVSNAYRSTDLTGHTCTLTALAFDPSSTHVASASDDGNVILWDTTTAKQHTIVQQAEAPAMTNRFDKCNPATPSIYDERGITALRFSPDGQYLAMGDRRGRISVVEVASNSPKHVLQHSERITIDYLQFSNNGAVLFSAGNDRRIFSWNMQTGEHIGSVNSTEHSAFNRVMGLTIRHKTLEVVYCLQGVDACEVVSFDGNKVTDIAFYRPRHTEIQTISEDYIVLAGVQRQDIFQGLPIIGQPDPTIFVLKLDDALLTHQTLRGHGDRIANVVISEDGSTLVSASLDKSVRVWALQP
jgi:WD40 repeat protein